MMQRFLTIGTALPLLFAGLANQCSSGGDDDTPPMTSTPAPTPFPTPTPPPGSVYPGHGFIVHEWGTDTVVVGSSGSLQRGLHHEEEDLPDFVYDRVKAGALTGSTSVEVKMETPVTYFYSEKPLTVATSVGFPYGVFTQWYPAALQFTPHIAAPGAVNGQVPTAYQDPVLDLTFPFSSQNCKDKYPVIKNGLLDWGQVQILDRNVDVSGQYPAAPLDKYSWSFARQVASNPVQISSNPGAAKAQLEQFLFYRGLGNFKLPVVTTSSLNGQVSLTNNYVDPVGTVFVVNVGASSGAFTVHPEGIAPGKTLTDVAPSLTGADPLDLFADELGEAVTDALDDTGLYHDEAVAMVNTWKRQWFRTPGIRLFYLAPQSWTDASIPLTLAPKPDSVLRVMVIRVELITPELETLDKQAAQGFAVKETYAQAQSYFDALGRFDEPRLRRALELLGNPTYADSYLAQIATANTTISMGE